MHSKIIFLFTILPLLAVINVLSAQDFKEVDKTFKMDKTGIVTIDTYKGEITVETWDRPEVHVYAKIAADEQFWGTRAKKQIENADVVIDDSPGSVKIKSKYHHSNSIFGSNTMAFVNYKIQMPKTAELKIEDYKSNTKIHSLQSSIRLVTYKGEARVTDLSGSINLETYKGEAEVSFSNVKNDSKLETSKGKITVSVPAKQAFTVSTDFGRKADFTTDFNIDRDTGRRKHDGYNFKKDINGGGPVLKLASDKGDIRLRSK
jgi:hypothetical protein